MDLLGARETVEQHETPEYRFTLKLEAALPGVFVVATSIGLLLFVDLGICGFVPFRRELEQKECQTESLPCLRIS